MSEEELNQELSTDELKDVAGGATAIEYGFIVAMHEKKEKGSTNSPKNYKKSRESDSFSWGNRDPK